MNIFNRYSIAYKGLSVGVHHYSFDVDDALFKAFECPDIFGGKLSVEIDLTKSGSMLQLYVEIKGDVRVQCDRCLEEVIIPIDYHGELIVRFSDEASEYDGDILWVSPSETEINLSQYIYESIFLSLPYQRVHQTLEECNPEMVKSFKIVSPQELEELESKSTEIPIEDNPQWDKLKELK